MIEKPPSTGIAVPVTKSEAGEARNTATPAKSSIAPQRAAGVRASTRSCRPPTSTRARLVRSVSIQPGSMALAWMLSPAQAQAQERVNWTMPPCDPRDPSAIPASAQPYMKLAPVTQLVSVELTYRDGSVSEIKSFRR